MLSIIKINNLNDKNIIFFRKNVVFIMTYNYLREIFLKTLIVFEITSALRIKNYLLYHTYLDTCPEAAYLKTKKIFYKHLSSACDPVEGCIAQTNIIRNDEFFCRSTQWYYIYILYRLSAGLSSSLPV